MRLLEVFKDFLKIFIPVEKKKLAINYSAKVKDWSLSKSQLIEKKFILKQINLFKKKKNSGLWMQRLFIQQHIKKKNFILGS